MNKVAVRSIRFVCHLIRIPISHVNIGLIIGTDRKCRPFYIIHLIFENNWSFGRLIVSHLFARQNIISNSKENTETGARNRAEYKTDNTMKNHGTTTPITADEQERVKSRMKNGAIRNEPEGLVGYSHR